MRFRGILLGVVVLSGAALAYGGPTAGAMPQNDVIRDRVAPQIFVPDSDLTGVRRPAERVGGPAVSESLTGLPDDDGDPPLVKPLPHPGLEPFSNCPARDLVALDPTTSDWYALRTVWYEITQDTLGSAFAEPTLVTIDTFGSTFGAALEVFSGSGPPVAFNPNFPVLPTNVVACDRTVPSAVSFIAKPGLRYFLMAGVAPMSSSSGTLRLSMRILDIKAPVVTISLEQTPDAGDVFEYTVAAGDRDAPTGLSVTQQQEGHDPVKLTPVGLGSKCDTAHMKNRIGRYCVLGTSVLVRWRGVNKEPKWLGRVAASFTDRAGNVGVNSLRTQLRDREPPRLGKTNAHWTRRGRLYVASTCTGGPGTITVEVGAARKRVGSTTFTRSTMRMRKAFPRVTRRTTFIHVVCKDRSKNPDDTWLFLPR